MVSRKCGPCTECCSALGVHELNKLEFTRCEHICETGCSIYKDRPQSCRTFKCLWLCGDMGWQDRPDRLGIVFSAAIAVGRRIILAHVQKPGAEATERAQELLRYYARTFPVVIIEHDYERSLLIAPELQYIIPELIKELDARCIVGEDGKVQKHLPVVK